MGKKSEEEAELASVQAEKAKKLAEKESKWAAKKQADLDSILAEAAAEQAKEEEAKSVAMLTQVDKVNNKEGETAQQKKVIKKKATQREKETEQARKGNQSQDVSYEFKEVGEHVREEKVNSAGMIKQADETNKKQEEAEQKAVLTIQSERATKKTTAKKANSQVEKFDQGETGIASKGMKLEPEDEHPASESERKS